MGSEKLASLGIPSDFRRASAGIPSLSVLRTKPTTYLKDRYDSIHISPPVHSIHSGIEIFANTKPLTQLIGAGGRIMLLSLYPLRAKSRKSMGVLGVTAVRLLCLYL